MPESIRLYAFCKATKFSALPVVGGIYDQDPQLIEEWDYIMRVESIVENRRQQEQNRKSASANRVRGR